VAVSRLNVNGATVSITVDDPDTPLLYILRNELGLHGPRFGCGLGQCGACTVHIDGDAVRPCITPLSSVKDGNVVTLEGLGTDERPHPVQQAFVEEQAVQCGYCINALLHGAYEAIISTLKADRRAAFDRDYLKDQVEYQKGKKDMRHCSNRKSRTVPIRSSGNSRVRPCRRSWTIWSELRSLPQLRADASPQNEATA
jgi:nicotinate dehydrogenase subunit A